MKYFDIRQSLVGAAVLIGASALVIAPRAFAQAQTSGDKQDDSAAVEEIIVTGSRIKRAGVDTFYPAISVGTEELEDGAFTNVADALNEIPSFGNPDATPFGAQNTFSVGQNFVDFLGLGAQRTLTLVNGRRFVSSNTPSIFGENGGLQVDFNVIPVALVERIETIGVGGAPIYGSDAIAGTINVILKDRFEGVQVNYRTGTTDKSDGDIEQITLVAGANFSDDRGNVTMSMESFTQEGLLQNTRPRFTANDPFFASDEDADPNDPNTDQVRRIYYDQHVQLFADGGAVSGPIGLFIPSFGAGSIWGDLADGVFYQFDSNSNLIPFRPGQDCPGSAFFACRGQDPNGPDHDGPDFFDNVAQIQSPLDRKVFSARMNYDITDRTTFSADVIFAKTKADELVNQGGFQTFAFGGTSGALTFPVDNPFLPQQARDIFMANGLSSFVLHRFNNDIIDSSNFRQQFLWHATAGLEGDFDVGERNFVWSITATNGESDADTRVEGIIDDRFLSAIDAIRLTAADFVDDNGTPLDPTDDTAITPKDLTDIGGTTTAEVGDIVCRSVVDVAFGRITGTSGNGVTDEDLPAVTGCVPLNLFGQGVRSDAAREWVTGDQMTQSSIEQNVVNLNFGGDLFELPGGWLAFNAGYENRKEQAVFTPGTGSEVPITRNSPFSETGGRYETDEYYGEVVIPLISADNDIPFMEFAELNGAYRNIDNTLAGNQDVWTAGVRLAPVRDISFRANYTESIRAPSLVELFAPRTQTFDFADDPCDRRFINDAPDVATRTANCAMDIANYDPAAFTSNIVNATAIGVTGGNPNLQNEKAQSYAIGMNFEPRWVDNLLITADYINIELSDAILELSTTQLMKACYDSSVFPAPPLADGTLPCGAFTRDATGQVVSFLEGQANASAFKYEQLNFGINYNFDVSDFFGLLNNNWSGHDFGNFATRIRLNHPLTRRISVIGVADDNTIGGFGDPRWSGTYDFIWSGQNARVFWRVLWQNKSLLDPAGHDLFEAPNGNRIRKADGRFMNNITLSYNLDSLFPGAPDRTMIQLTVNNAFNRQPNLVQEARGYFSTAELYGRFFTLTLQGNW